MTEQERRGAWKAIAADPVWKQCEQDLLLFISSDDNPVVRAGRMDVFVYILDSIIGEDAKEA